MAKLHWSSFMGTLALEIIGAIKRSKETYKCPLFGNTYKLFKQEVEGKGDFYFAHYRGHTYGIYKVGFYWVFCLLGKEQTIILSVLFNKDEGKISFADTDGVLPHEL